MVELEVSVNVTATVACHLGEERERINCDQLKVRSQLLL